MDHSHRFGLRFFIIGLAGAAMTVSAWAQPADTQSALADRLTRLESAVQDLQATVYSVEGDRYSAPLRSYELPDDAELGGELVVRISQLERELQSLTGRMEELAYQIEQNSRRMDTLQDVMSAQNPGLNQGAGSSGGYQSDGYSSDGGYISGGGATAGPADLGGGAVIQSGGDGFPVEESVTESPSVARVALPTDVDEAYDYAFNALLGGDYQLAESAFITFLETYPDDPRAADAQFRLGEIYLATGDNLNAAKTFLDHIKRWPDDARSAETHLRLGTSYGRLGRTEAACNIFRVMDAKFPNASSALRQRLASERATYGC